MVELNKKDTHNTFSKSPRNQALQYGITNPGHQSIACQTAEAALDLLVQERRARVFEAWMRGNTMEQIAESEGVAESTVIRCIASQRERLKELYEGEMGELAAERIANLQNIKAEAYKYMGWLPTKAPQLLQVALRAEETTAKIQGVLNEKHLHLGKIQHDVKMYDFTDRTPAPYGAEVVDEQGQPVEPNPTIARLEEEELVQRHVVVEVLGPKVPSLVVDY